MDEVKTESLATSLQERKSKISESLTARLLVYKVYHICNLFIRSNDVNLSCLRFVQCLGLHGTRNAQFRSSGPTLCVTGTV
jgi:hypothetical protein